MKKCSGCGRYDNEPLGLNKKGEPYLACCPDNNYVQVSPVEWLINHWKKLQAQGEKMSWNQIIEITELTKEMEKQQKKVDENTSDGYHTFKELYEFRKAYNVALFNDLAEQQVWASEDNQPVNLPKYDVHKSWKHHNGELCFGGGWFIVVAVLAKGQISNHYKAEDWDLFKIPSVEKAKYEFDGHTSEDVITRLINI